jgi:hypothetical protein
LDDRTKIAEIDLEKKKKGEDGQFRLRTSSDSSKVLIYYYEPNSKKENQVIGFHVFDGQMKQIWENEVELPYKGEFFKPVNYTLDNNGNAYIMGKLYKDKLKETKDDRPNYKYLIIACTEKGETLSEYEVDLDGKFVSELGMKMNDKTGKLICAGYYSNQNTGSVKGSFFLSIDPVAKKIEKKHMQAFTFEQMMQNQTKETKAKVERKAAKKGVFEATNGGTKDVELSHISLNYILLRDDGGVVLMGEYEHIYTYSTTSYDGKRWVTTYHTAYIWRCYCHKCKYRW